MKKHLRTSPIFILIPLIAIFLVKLYLVHPSFSDENIYYSMGKVIDEGQKPYYDFNYVHPPIQIYILAAVFKLFGTSLVIAKLVPLFASSLAVVMIFLISKKLFDEKSALVGSLLFIITPVFIAFSDQGYGIWETLLFILISFYLSLKEKYLASGIFFSVAVFTRYLSVLFFPLMLITLFFQKLRWKKFFIYSAASASALFLFFYSIYGFNFIDQSLLFQLFAKSNPNILPKLPFQYLGFGFFSIFLASISLIIGITKKEKLVVLFSLYPLLIDVLIFSGFTVIIYHYFLISFAFVFLALGRTFTLVKDKIIQLGIIVIILVSIYHNLPTIDYYQNPAYSQQFLEIVNFVSNATTKGDKIFGESSITTYIMFDKGIPISFNYLDSFLSYLVYKDERTVVANLEKEKPKVIIDMNSYYEANPVFSQYLAERYQKEKTFSGMPTYIVYVRK